MARLPAANPLSGCISAPRSLAERPSWPDLYPGRVRKGLERFASWARSRLLISLAGRLAGGQRALRPTPGFNVSAGPRLSQGTGWPSPSWGMGGKETELNSGRTAPRLLFVERHCTGRLESSFVSVARAPSPRRSPSVPRVAGQVWLPAKRPSQQRPRRAARGRGCASGLRAEKKPQVGAETEPWAAPLPAALQGPVTRGRSRGRGGSRGAHMGPEMGGPKKA